MKSFIKIRLIVLSIGIIFLIVLGINTAKKPLLRVWFFDVGQGDSIFIETPDGAQVLIDGGPDATVLRRLNKVMGFFDRSINIVMMSHPDADHINGLPLVLRRYTADLFIEPGVSSDNGAYSALEHEIEIQNIPKVIAKRNMRFNLGKNVNLDILFPDTDVSRFETNTASIIARLSYASTSVLFTGDSPKVIENHLVDIDGVRLKSNILKAGHHGSHTSSGEYFIKAVSPEFTVISAGKNNRYGHPHKEVLDTFEKLKIQYANTADAGTIECSSDGMVFSCK